MTSFVHTPKQAVMREWGTYMMLRETRRGLAYVNPVERFTPARNAETVGVLVSYAVLEEGFGLLRTASNA